MLWIELLRFRTHSIESPSNIRWLRWASNQGYFAIWVPPNLQALLSVLNESTQAQEGQDDEDDNDGSNYIDDSVHENYL